MITIEILQRLRILIVYLGFRHVRIDSEPRIVNDDGTFFALLVGHDIVNRLLSNRPRPLLQHPADEADLESLLALLTFFVVLHEHELRIPALPHLLLLDFLEAREQRIELIMLLVIEPGKAIGMVLMRLCLLLSHFFLIIRNSLLKKVDFVSQRIVVAPGKV